MSKSPDSSTGSRDAKVRHSKEVLERLARHTPPESRYASQGEIARGGMGAILAVEDVDLRRRVAMKVIREDRAEDGAAANQLHRFLEEAQVTAQLSHPGIVPVHELGVDARGRVFFTMALVQGRDLEHVFEDVRAGRAGWTATRALGVLQRVCETMAFAHSRGVIHRDLKPANVMVGGFGEVYVMDWGLAKVAGQDGARDVTPDLEAAAGNGALADGAARGGAGPVRSDRMDAASAEPDSSLLTRDGAILGTPAYMSPEQARGETLDERSDVYAVGAMLYALLTGRKPYALANAVLAPMQIVLAIHAGPPTPITRLAPDASPELAAICQKAMAREPGARYSDMQAMAEDLRAFLENRVVRAHRTGAWVELVKWVRRNRGLAIALLGLVLVALAGSGTFAMKERERAETERTGRVRQSALSDLRVSLQLTAAEQELWPAHPRLLPEFDRWLADARAIQARLPEHRALRDELLAASWPAAEGAPVERAAGERTFATEQDAAVFRSIDELASKAADFGVLVRHVEERRARAARLAVDTLEGSAERARWRAALEDIAKSEVYSDLTLAPQLGLLPLRRDPRSNLWEFWHVQTGDEPALARERDSWRIAPETGIVLVLVPSEIATIGSIPTDKRAPPLEPYEDPYRKDDEVFHTAIPLDAYFLSKYETTFGQWSRLELTTEVTYDRGSDVHPVQHITWKLASEGARRAGLALPTEAQWEHACRAGTTSPFSYGDLLEPLAAFGNFADRTLLEQDPGFSSPSLGTVADGFARLAPVGSFKPNAFGLHDLHGNVWEFCADPFGTLDGPPPRPGDGLREGPRREAALRGGSYFTHPEECRSANRLNYSIVGEDGDLGVRFARRVE